jgi:hypothetical protein
VIRIVIVLAVLGCLVSAPSIAADRQAIDIPAQDLGPALRRLAKERHLQIIYASEDVSKHRTQGAVGDLTDVEALERVLEGTGLTYRSLDAKTLTLTPAQTEPLWNPLRTPSLPEVEIIARNRSLRVLRERMVKLEDRFFTEYNALNPNNQFDIHCERRSPTGSNIDRRVCRPVFVDRAMDDARTVCHEGVGAAHCAYNVRPHASAVILAKASAYEKNVEEMIGMHRRLRELVDEHEDLEKRYKVLLQRASRHSGE